MRSRVISLAVLRARLEINHFYDDIIFEGKSVGKEFKKIVEKWLFNLERYKHIRLEKFRSLFSQLQEVIFPIKIEWCYESIGRCNIEFLDNEGKKYYFIIIDYLNWNNMDKYIIERRNSFLEPLIDRVFNYKIIEDQTISLIKTTVMQLKLNKDADDKVVEFSYDYKNSTTKATLKFDTATIKIELTYPSKNSVFDKKVQEYLFNLTSTKCYYDVLPILKWIALVMKNEITICITSELEDDERSIIFSIIEVENDIVQIYIKTEVVGYEEIRTTRKIFAKNLEEFIAENS